MKRKKLGFLALTAVVLAFTLSACAGQEAQTSNGDTAKQEITVMLPDWGAPTAEMLADFEAESGIKVNLQRSGWDEIKQKVSVASAGNNAAADVFEVDWSWVGEFQSAGWLEPLDIPQEVIDDTPSLAYFMVDGKYYALPYINDMRLAYANTAMLNEAGVDNVPTNWDELEQDFEALNDAGVSEHPFLFPLNAEEKTTTSFLTLAYTRNNIIFNEDGSINRESALDTLQLIEHMVDAGYIDPMSVSTPGIDVFKGIQSGSGAYLAGPSSYVTSTNNPEVSTVVGQVEAIPFPGKDGVATSSISFTEAIGISAFSENKQAAQTFVEWYMKPETQKKLNHEISIMPTRTSVLEEMISSGELDAPEFIIEQSQRVTSPFPNGVPKYYTQMSTEIFNIINQLGQGKIDAEQAADTMVEKIDALIASNQ